MKMMHGANAKLTVAGITGAIVGVILWLLHEFAKVDVPDEVAAWLAIIVGVAVGFVSGGKANGSSQRSTTTQTRNDPTNT